MPPYTDSPLGSFLSLLGQGIPALAQGHRVRGIQDQQLALQQQQEALRIKQLQTSVDEHPQDRAFEQYTRANQVDPLGAVVLQRDKLKEAGIPLPDNYIPPDKRVALEKQKFIDSIFSGGDGAPQGEMPQQGGAPQAGVGGESGPASTQKRLAYALAFPGINLQQLFGPVNEPTVNVQTTNDQGQVVTKVMGRSQAVGHEFPVAPTGAQRTQLTGAENIDAIAAQVQNEFNPDYVGPAAGRWKAFEQMIPGFKTDPKVAKFYATTSSLLNITMNNLSGAAVNEHEAARILGQVPSQTDKPEVFLAKLQTTRENNQRLQQIILQKQGGQAAPAPQGQQMMPQQQVRPQASASNDQLLQQYADQYFGGDLMAARQAAAASIAKRR